MVKHPNLLWLFPGVMLDQFLALPLSSLYFHHLFCPKVPSRRALDVTPEPFLSPDQYVVLFSRQYPAAGYGNGYPYQSHPWQPVAWQDDRGMGSSFGYGDGGSLQDKWCFPQGGFFSQGLHISRALSCPTPGWWCSGQHWLPVCI